MVETVAAQNGEYSPALLSSVTGAAPTTNPVLLCGVSVGEVLLLSARKTGA
jgi:hypothetical protein